MKEWDKIPTLIGYDKELENELSSGGFYVGYTPNEGDLCKDIAGLIGIYDLIDDGIYCETCWTDCDPGYRIDERRVFRKLILKEIDKRRNNIEEVENLRRFLKFLMETDLTFLRLVNAESNNHKYSKFDLAEDIKIICGDVEKVKEILKEINCKG